MGRHGRWTMAVVVGMAMVTATTATGCGDEQGTDAGQQPRDTPESADTPGDDMADDAPPDNGTGALVPVTVAVADRQQSDADPTMAGAAISAFGVRLFVAARAADPEANLNLSPASVAVALAMVEPGAVDEARDELRTVLGISDPVAYHAAMNALEQELEHRQPQRDGAVEDPGELTIGIANAAYLQHGYPFQAPYLDAVGTNYGAVLNEVDFAADPDGVARHINAFVAEETNQRITDLLPPGAIDPATVLALVNALYLKASWLQPFDPDNTVDGPFTLAGGDDVTVPLMYGSSSSSARGDGWIGATKAYVGGLSAQFILPDDGRFGEIADDLDTVFEDYRRNLTSGHTLAVPRIEVRTNLELTTPLQALGLAAPFRPGGLLGIAPDERLVVDKIAHEAVVIMDEEGTEAAAATVLLAAITSAPPAEPVPVILDRPFLYRIVDNATGATLFVGQVMDPRS